MTMDYCQFNHVVVWTAAAVLYSIYALGKWPGYKVLVIILANVLFLIPIEKEVQKQFIFIWMNNSGHVLFSVLC